MVTFIEHSWLNRMVSGFIDTNWLEMITCAIGILFCLVGT